MIKIVLIVCVLAGVLNAKFIRDNAKEVALDTQTNLVWQDDRNSSIQTQNWSNAIVYCEASTLGGYNDWHLPHFNELYHLANREKYNPALNSGFMYVSTNTYWSSTSDSTSGTYTWAVFFYLGSSVFVTKDGSNYVRCVRDGQ